MVSEHSTPTTGDEPLLGAPPALSDDSWEQMLNSAFEAPPGYADGIVDVFEAPESADDSIDADDDHTIDFDGVAGGAGEANADAGSDAESGDEVDPDAVDTDAVDADDVDTDAVDAEGDAETVDADDDSLIDLDEATDTASGSATETGTETGTETSTAASAETTAATPASTSSATEADDDFSFGIDTLLATGTEADTDALESGVGSDDAFTIDPADLDSDDLGTGLDGDYGAGEHFI